MCMCFFLLACVSLSRWKNHSLPVGGLITFMLWCNLTYNSLFRSCIFHFARKEWKKAERSHGNQFSWCYCARSLPFDGNDWIRLHPTRTSESEFNYAELVISFRLYRYRLGKNQKKAMPYFVLFSLTTLTLVQCVCGGQKGHGFCVL